MPDGKEAVVMRRVAYSSAVIAVATVVASASPWVWQECGAGPRPVRVWELRTFGCQDNLARRYAMEGRCS